MEPVRSFATLLFFFLLVQGKAQIINVNAVIAEAEKQTEYMLKETASIKATSNKPSLISPRTYEKGELKLVPARDWTSGFFAGQLWLLYEGTGKKMWKTEAEKFIKDIDIEQYDKTSHDVGFKIYCSVGAAYRLTKVPVYKAVIIQAAATLSKRFNPVTGAIKSWDNTKWQFPVIIDNMMNLELLFEASKLSGDSSFYKIAIMHANTTIKNHFRDDFSSFHLVNYDSSNGKVLGKNTVQGFADASAWARGQAWGLYGYTMCYRETKNKIYLDQAKHIADFILNNKNLPKDMIPYWDFNASAIPDEPKDASAAAIMASALLELSTYSNKGEKYSAKANTIIENLTHSYRSGKGENKGFLLAHSTGHKPNNSEVDVPMIYADYYYMEALLRSKKLKEKKKLF